MIDTIFFDDEDVENKTSQKNYCRRMAEAYLTYATLARHCGAKDI